VFSAPEVCVSLLDPQVNFEFAQYLFLPSK
jgi:hypothetical protein